MRILLPLVDLLMLLKGLVANGFTSLSESEYLQFLASLAWSFLLLVWEGQP